MNFGNFGGDNRDHGKGFVLGSLAGALNRLHVDAMITDEPWPCARCEEMLATYRRFLRLTPDQAIDNADVRYQGGTHIPRNRRLEDYFQPHYDADYDLFLDPNDGIHPDGGSKDGHG